MLYLFFPFYRGLTGEGGKLYSPFLDQHLNIVKWLSGWLTSSARLLLQAFHYTVNQKDYHTLRIENSRGIIVNPSCLGWGVMSFWIAFVFAHSNNLKFKLKWMVGGVLAICLLNITRIALITLANHLNWQSITSLDHHQTFNVLSYSCIFLLMVLFIKTQKKYEALSFGAKHKNHALSTV